MQHAQSEGSQPAWNPFAQALQEILRAHGMELSQLDDRMGIHREKVRRLVQSLTASSSLPTLNPEELETISTTLHLQYEEVQHLYAALLATAVQRMLSDRIHGDDARLAAEQILPLLTQALITHPDGRGLGNIRGDVYPTEDMGLFIALEAALEASDRGDSALQLSTSTRFHAERVRQAQQAYDYYTEAVQELERLSRTIQRLPGWKSSWNATQKGLELAHRRLQDLGEI